MTVDNSTAGTGVYALDGSSYFSAAPTSGSATMPSWIKVGAGNSKLTCTDWGCAGSVYWRGVNTVGGFCFGNTSGAATATFTIVPNVTSSHQHAGQFEHQQRQQVQCGGGGRAGGAEPEYHHHHPL